MNNMYKVFGCYTDLQLNNIFNKLDLTVTEMINMDDIVENKLLSVDEKRTKLLEMFSYSPCVENYSACEEIFNIAKEKEEKKKQLKENERKLRQLAKKSRPLKEDALPNNNETSKLNMNQTIELNSLFELASEKFKKVNCSQQFYNLLSQKTSKNIANAFFNMLKSIPEDSECRFDPQLVIDSKNFAETISPFVNELKTFLNGCKAEKKEEVNEDYDADKLHKIDIQIAQLENNLKKFEEEGKDSYLDEYSKLQYKLDRARLGKLKAKREEYLNESIKKEISFDDIKEFAEKYDLIPTNKNEKANNKTYAKFITYPKSMNFNNFKKDALKKFGNNIEVIKGTKLKNNRFIVGIWYNGIDNLNESIETQPDMFGGPDTYYKDGIEALDFDNVLDAMNKIAPEMDFVDDRNVKGKYSMIFQPKSSGLELNQKGLKKIKDYLSQRFGKENISVKLAHSQYAPEIKKLYVSFINQIDVQNELNESLEDTLNNFKYFITSSNNEKELNYIKDKLEILFNQADDVNLQNEISEILSMIKSKLNKTKPIVDECCGIDSLLEPFKPTVINITINDDGCLEDNEKELCANSMKALASHINDEKDCCEENNIENMQTINSLLGTIANYFHTKLSENKINPHLDEFPNINILNESIDEYRKYAGIYDLNSDTISFLPKGTIHYNFINEMDVFKGKVRFGITEYKNSVVGYICSDTREHVMKVLKKLKKKFSSLPIDYWMIEYFEDGKRIKMNIDNYGRSIYENKNDWFPSWENIKNKVIKENQLNEEPLMNKIKRGVEKTADNIHNAGIKVKQKIGMIDSDESLRNDFIEYLIRVYMAVFDKGQNPHSDPIEMVQQFGEKLVRADSKFKKIHDMVLQKIDNWCSSNIGRNAVINAIKNQLAHIGVPNKYINKAWEEFKKDPNLTDWSKEIRESLKTADINLNEEELEESSDNMVYDPQQELNDIKQSYLDGKLDYYDAIKEVENITGNEKIAKEKVDLWDDSSKHGLYGITDDEELDEDTVYDHSWYEVKGQKYPRRTKNGVEISEMCSGGACCAGAVATVPSPAKPKTPKRKHKKSKVDEMALNMFKRQIIEDVNSQFNANGNHYEFRNGYLYINGNIARTKSKYKMFEALDEMIELETLPGFNSSEMIMLEDIEANGSVGNEDDNNQDNNNNNNNNANNNNNQQNINKDNLGDVNQNVTQDNDLTPEQRQLKKDTEKVLDQSLNSGSDTEVSVNQGFDNNNDQTTSTQSNTNNTKYKIIGKDDSDSNNIKYIIQDPNTKETMVVDATKLRLEK